MKPIPIVLLAYDSIILRAYLSVFKELNLRPEKIVVLLFNRLPLQKTNLIGSYFPNPLKKILLQSSIDKQMNYYPRFIKHKFPETYKLLSNSLKERYTFSDIFLELIDNKIPYKEFSDNISYLNIQNYKDNIFIDFISKIEHKTLFLYTGGGILSASSFSNPLVKYLHVHPGYLPFVRGADCYLWSTLLFNHIGASSFFMSPGIDEGNILVADRLPPISIPFSNESNFDTKTLYRIVYSYFDPCLRAEVLKTTLNRFDHLWEQKGMPQSPKDGNTFYFMNDFLKDLALKRIFIQ